jgi:hypothetical protein
MIWHLQLEVRLILSLFKLLRHVDWLLIIGDAHVECLITGRRGSEF